jgi:excisionase family DNA binding protein
MQTGDAILQPTQQTRPLGIEDAADFTGYSVKYLYKLTSQNRITFYKPNGGRIFFKREDLDSFINRGRQAADYELGMKAERLLAGGGK